MTTYPLLDTINPPARLRELAVEQLPALAEELRRFLIESVAQTSFGSPQPIRHWPFA